MCWVLVVSKTRTSRERKCLNACGNNNSGGGATGYPWRGEGGKIVSASVLEFCYDVVSTHPCSLVRSSFRFLFGTHAVPKRIIPKKKRFGEGPLEAREAGEKGTPSDLRT